MAGQNGLETKKRKVLPFIYIPNPKFPRERFDRVKNVIFTAPYCISLRDINVRETVSFRIFVSQVYTN